MPPAESSLLPSTSSSPISSLSQMFCPVKRRIPSTQSREVETEGGQQRRGNGEDNTIVLKGKERATA